MKRAPWTDEQRAARKAWHRRRAEAMRAAGLCPCGKVATVGSRCLPCKVQNDERRPLKSVGRGSASSKAYEAARRAAKAALVDLRPPIIPVVCSAVIVGGAVAVAR